MPKVVAKHSKKPAQSPSLLGFDVFLGQLRHQFILLPNIRSGQNSLYAMSDAALAAFSVFFTQSPSFLAHQRQMNETKGRNNANSLFQVSNIPSDAQIRNLFDPLEPPVFSQPFEHSLEHLSQDGHLDNYRSINGTLLVALDGVCYHSSKRISCDKCYERHHHDGSISYSHSAITPVIVAPGHQHVVSIMPEFITLTRWRCKARQ